LILNLRAGEQKLKIGTQPTITGVDYRSVITTFGFEVLLIILPTFLSSNASTDKQWNKDTNLGELDLCSEGSCFSVSSLGILSSFVCGFSF
jgi:hypothetical protein